MSEQKPALQLVQRRVIMSIRMPEGLHHEVKRIAVERGVTLNSVMVELARKWVEYEQRAGRV